MIISVLLIQQYPSKLAVYDIPLNRKTYGIDKDVVPQHPVKGEPTPEELERRRPKGYKLTLDRFERDDDIGNVSDMKELNMSIVNNKLTITKMTDDEKKHLITMKRRGKVHIKNHGTTLQVDE